MSRLPDGTDSDAGTEPPDLQTLAGEYVLGTLAPDARRAFAARLPQDAALRALVDAWEARLLPLVALVEPVAPSKALWERIDRSTTAVQPEQSEQQAKQLVQLQPESKKQSQQRSDNRWHWNSLALWRLLTGGALALSTVLAILLVQRGAMPAANPQFMVVLVGPQDKAPGWVIQASLSRQLSLIPLGAAAVPPDKALQFWTKGEGWSGPVSLGLVRPGQAVQISLDRLPELQPNQLFELTLEPVTGSPSGRPTGPVQFIGRAVKVM
jgi:anti-sigma-K factor RskA